MRVQTAPESEEAVFNLLLELGAQGTATVGSSLLKNRESQYGEWFDEAEESETGEEKLWIAGYIKAEDFQPSLVEKLKKRVENLTVYGLNPGPAEVEARRVSEEFWEKAWKEYYRPTRITDRLTVKPLWESYRPEPGETVIELDPGMAFGTGTHPTTVLSMKLLEETLQPGQRVIDVGCGSGILSIASARLGAETVLAVDLDPRAVENAERNVRLNDLQHRIRVREGDLLQDVDQTADLVVSNILAEIILQFTADLPRVLRRGGVFIASGIIAEKEKEVVRAVHDAGLTVMKSLREGDWVALAARS